MLALASTPDVPEDTVENTAVATPVEREPIAAITDNDDPVVPEPSTNPGPRLTITFARSSSPTFPLVRRRLDSLAPLGSLSVAKDDVQQLPIDASADSTDESDLQ
jgi:hypothetical protein